MRLVASKRRWWVVHGDVIGMTLCGHGTQGWTEVAKVGSLHSITCRACVRCLIASGDLPRDEPAGGAA